jgi:hypothetical protein
MGKHVACNKLKNLSKISFRKLKETDQLRNIYVGNRVILKLMCEEYCVKKGRVMHMTTNVVVLGFCEQGNEH